MLIDSLPRLVSLPYWVPACVFKSGKTTLFPNITNLQLYNLESPEMLEIVVKKCRNLKKLSLRGENHVLKISALKNLGSLTHLVLSNFSLSESCFDSFAQFKSLKILRFQFISFPDHDQSAHTLGKALSKISLKALEIKGAVMSVETLKLVLDHLELSKLKLETNLSRFSAFSDMFSSLGDDRWYKNNPKSFHICASNRHNINGVMFPQNG